jgi:hypothetical protein
MVQNDGVEITGARVCSDCGKNSRERKNGGLGFTLGGGKPLYSRPGAAAFISRVQEAAVDWVTERVPPSCFHLREEDDDSFPKW